MKTLLLFTLLAAGMQNANPLPDHRAADPSAAVVTPATLLASERFWPYQIELVRPLGTLGAGTTGVLIRVSDADNARVDFGRDGRFEVPIAATDVVARANQVRLGEREKAAPHFVYAMGTRLLDPSHPELRALPLAALTGRQRFLCVFADPRSPDFAALAKALAPLRERDGVQTILFPQGRVPDPEVRETLRALEWPVPFVYDHLAEAYTRSLLDDGVDAPAVLLQTDEGRVLFQSDWSADVPSRLDGFITASPR